MTAAENRSRPRGSGPEWLHQGALALLAVVKVVTAACASAGALHPTAKRYRGKAMRVRAVGYFGGLGLVPMIWAAQRGRRPYPAGADLAVSVPLLIDAAGNTLGIYDDARLDDLIHGVNAAVLASLFGAVISPHLRSRQQATAATMAFGVVGELSWELMEYSADAIGFKGMMLSDDDTISDIVAAFIGAAIAAAITWTRWRPSPEQPFADWGEAAPSTIPPKAVTPPDLSPPIVEDHAGPGLKRGRPRCAERSPRRRRIDAAPEPALGRPRWPLRGPRHGSGDGRRCLRRDW